MQGCAHSSWPRLPPQCSLCAQAVCVRCDNWEKGDMVLMDHQSYRLRAGLPCILWMGIPHFPRLTAQPAPFPGSGLSFHLRGSRPPSKSEPMGSCPEIQPLRTTYCVVQTDIKHLLSLPAVAISPASCILSGYPTYR